MDGHKRPDVVEYCSNIFLPLMALLKRRMVQWDFSGSKVTCVDPNLGPGKKGSLWCSKMKAPFMSMNLRKQHGTYNVFDPCGI